jgi:hypothetical protein
VIEQTSFLGMPLRTQRQRRTVVVLYYSLLLVFAILALWKPRSAVQFLLPQTITLGGLLGGIKFGGPVKAYAEPKLPMDLGSSTQTLNLEGRKPFGDVWSPLDERERTQRDRAHYEAYRILRITMFAGALLYFLGMVWAGSWLRLKTPELGWVLLVYVLSLPQSVLLWTEPEEPAGELTALPRP